MTHAADLWEQASARWEDLRVIGLPAEVDGVPVPNTNIANHCPMDFKTSALEFPNSSIKICLIIQSKYAEYLDLHRFWVIPINMVPS